MVELIRYFPFHTDSKSLKIQDFPPCYHIQQYYQFISCNLWSNSNYMCVMWLLCSKWQRTAVTESPQFMPSCPSLMNYTQVYNSYISVFECDSTAVKNSTAEVKHYMIFTGSNFTGEFSCSELTSSSRPPFKQRLITEEWKLLVIMRQYHHPVHEVQMHDEKHLICSYTVFTKCTEL